jgi:hypothetical protein
VHGDAADITVSELDLAGVQPRPDLEADPTQLVSERGRAEDPPSRAVEGGQESVAGRLDQSAAPLLDHPMSQLVVHVQEPASAPIAQLPGPFSRAHDVGKQYGGQHPLGFRNAVDAGQKLLDQVQRKLRCIPDEGQVGPWQLDQLVAPGMCWAR